MWHGKSTLGVLGAVGLSTETRIPQNALGTTMRVKWVMDARKYQKNPDIERFFSRQNWRIGETLHKIEQAFVANTHTSAGGRQYRP